MPQPVCELFNDQATGQAALDALRQQGFAASQAWLIAPQAGEQAEPAGADPLAGSIAAHGVAAARAADYAAALRRGLSLVIVEPPFGRARIATQVLAGFNPVEPDHVPEPAAAMAGDDPAPLSEALGLRLLWNNPTPLSSLLHWPVLSKDTAPGVQLWTNRPSPLSDALGLKVLINDDARHGKAPLTGAAQLPPAS